MKKQIEISILIMIILLLFTISGLAQPRFTLIYVVQNGDTIYDIANEYNTTVSNILHNNNIDNASKINIGDELVIQKERKTQENKPKLDYKLSLSSRNEDNYQLDVGRNYSVRYNPEQPLPEVNIPPDKIIKYYVDSGDTLYDLAESFNTSVGVIMALNNMDHSIIRSGEKINIPINNLTKRQVLAITVSQSDIEILARTIHGEARGEPYMGQVAVGAVIINRVLSHEFPDNIKDVVYQRSQFTAVADGQINYPPNNTAYRAAKEALGGVDPTMGSLYYYNPKTAENKSWFQTRKFVVSIGEHVFAK
ncbi:MAG: cell wall hydrolase [Halanaerobiales bacterium]|nr:cell wall hydrolase [Halanaerobiales bacterium]